MMEVQPAESVFATLCMPSTGYFKQWSMSTVIFLQLTFLTNPKTVTALLFIVLYFVSV
jgi:mannitol-specific phosphotransferase system IIBC component